MTRETDETGIGALAIVAVLWAITVMLLAFSGCDSADSGVNAEAGLPYPGSYECTVITKRGDSLRVTFAFDSPRYGKWSTSNKYVHTAPYNTVSGYNAETHSGFSMGVGTAPAFEFYFTYDGQDLAGRFTVSAYTALGSVYVPDTNVVFTRR